MTIAARCLYGWENLVDLEATVITGSDDNASWPASNLADPELDAVHRTADATGAKTVTFDFGSAKSFQALAVPLVNWRSTATIVWQRSSDGAAWTTITPAYSGGIQDTWPNSGEARNMFVALIADAVSYRYTRFTVTDASHPDGYLEAARAYIGPIVQPERNFGWGYKVGTKPQGLTEVQKTPTGTPHPIVGPEQRQWQIGYGSTLTDAEALDKFTIELDYGLGLGGTLLIVPNPTVTTRWYFENAWAMVSERDLPSYEFLTRWSKAYVFEERLA